MVDGIGALGYNKSVGNEPRQEYQMNDNTAALSTLLDTVALRALTEKAQSNVTLAMAQRRSKEDIRLLKVIRDNLERAYVAAQTIA